MNTRLRLKCEILNINVNWNHDMKKSWKQYKDERDNFVLVDEKFVRKFPQVVKCLTPFRLELGLGLIWLFPVGNVSEKRQFRRCLSSGLYTLSFSTKAVWNHQSSHKFICSPLFKRLLQVIELSPFYIQYIGIFSLAPSTLLGANSNPHGNTSNAMRAR